MDYPPIAMLSPHKMLVFIPPEQKLYPPKWGDNFLVIPPTLSGGIFIPPDRFYPPIILKIIPPYGGIKTSMSSRRVGGPAYPVFHKRSRISEATVA